jgi:hypothetical protein
LGRRLPLGILDSISKIHSIMLSFIEVATRLLLLLEVGTAITAIRTVH